MRQIAGKLKTEDSQFYRFDASGKEITPSIATQTREAGSMRENNKKRFKEVHDGKGIILVPKRDLRRKGGEYVYPSTWGSARDTLRRSVVQVVLPSKREIGDVKDSARAGVRPVEIIDSDSEEESLSAGLEPAFSRPMVTGGDVSPDRIRYEKPEASSDVMEVDESEDELAESNRMALGLSTMNRAMEDADDERSSSHPIGFGRTMSGYKRAEETSDVMEAGTSEDEISMQSG
jgi:hypothetical protein